jgi:hypothetical protein
MKTYYGPLKTAAQARKWSAILDRAASYDDQARGARVMLENNWHAIAARPELARRVEVLVDACKSEL